MVNRKQIVFLTISIVTLIVIIINMILIVKIVPGSVIIKNKKEDEVVVVPNAAQRREQEQQELEEKIKNEQEEAEKEELEKLKQMEERDRMEYYFSKFISYIKLDEYSKAYDLLYPEFKENYFKTEKDFINYAKKLYPKSVAFSYNDIQRQGYVYVLIIDVIDTSKSTENRKSQRIVIKEDGFNNFVLSFQVI